MLVYHVTGTIPLGADVLDVDIEIPRSEILAMKKQLRDDGCVFGDYITYYEMLRITSHFAAQLRLRMIPGTWLILLLLKACFIFVRLGIITMVILLIMRRWWWAIAVLVLMYIVNTYLQTLINYELGARLFVLDQHLREFHKRKEPNSYSSDALYYDNPNDHSPNAYGYCGIEREDEELMNAIRNLPEDGVKDEKTNDPLIEAQKKEMKNFLNKRLTRAERLILVLYYYEEMTIKEIAEELDLSEARVSQMHSSIVQRFRDYLS